METEFQKEAAQRKERLDRVLLEEHAANQLQEDRIAASLKQSEGKNESYFAAQEAYALKVAANKSISLPGPTNAEAMAAAKAAYPYKPYDPVMPKGRPSISLPTVPEKYASSDMRRGLSPEVMEQMGLDPNPEHSAIKK
jgi:hypothetical protein